MEVYADIRRKVNVNPEDVINELISEEIGVEHWTLKKKDKYYSVHEESAGQHSFEVEEEISKKTYEYIEALKLILNHLKHKNKTIG